MSSVSQAHNASPLAPRPSDCYNLVIDNREVVDHLGKLLFGRPIRLRVLLWVLDRGDAVFFQAEAASGVDYKSSTAVAAELDRLERLGMVRRYGRPIGNERQNYVRLESDYWNIVAVTRASLEHSEDDQATEAG